MSFTFEEGGLAGLVLVTPRIRRDARGFFFERYREQAFRAAGVADRFVQDNHSRSKRGVIRGLHFQVHPAAQAKLVWVVSGEVFDVAVDLRAGSPAYGKWAGHRLSAGNRRMLYIPAGFAHGFAVLSRGADVMYKVSAPYSAAHERGLRWNDPDLGIAWPVEAPVLSERDRGLPLLREAGIASGR